MDFRYRFVPFGTDFENAPGARTTGSGPAHLLYENEIATDVGRSFWGDPGSTDRVIDHHFEKPDQFPSASSAVLHSAQHIHNYVQNQPCEPNTFWLVTHRAPDFDALCALYLVRWILLHPDQNPDWTASGASPSSWSKPANAGFRINWKGLECWRHDDEWRSYPERRWQALLASFASHIDNGWRFACPRHLSLHAFFCAAIERGRLFEREQDGGFSFFESARSLVAAGLDPLTDVVLSRDPEYHLEYEMLLREPDSYRRDLARARRSIVTLPCWDANFHSFRKSCAARVLEPAGSSRGLPAFPLERTRAVDAIYLRDPESILFKEWARRDIENSSLGQGFTFSAIAYSNDRPEGQVNSSDYFFSIDQERADGAHLYPVWETLQRAELDAWLRPEYAEERDQLASRDSAALLRHQAAGAAAGSILDPLTGAPLRDTICRKGFESRAGLFRHLMGDPWFDGENFEYTIVPTPNGGTRIAPPGERADLMDDPVVLLVRHLIELPPVVGQVFIEEVPLFVNTLHLPGPGNSISKEGLPDLLASPLRPSLDTLRFASMELGDSSSLVKGMVPRQLGLLMWNVLHGNAEELPEDFDGHHLIRERHLLMVWSRRGLFVAFHSQAREVRDRLHEKLVALAQLYSEVRPVLNNAREAADRDASPNQKDLTEASGLLLRLLELRQDLAYTEFEALRRMCNELRLESALTTLHSLQDANLARLQYDNMLASTDALRKAQEHAHLVEGVVLTIYLVELSHILIPLLRNGRKEIVEIRAIASVALVALLLAVGPRIPALLTHAGIRKAVRPAPLHGQAGSEDQHSTAIASLILIGLVLVVLLVALASSICFPDRMSDFLGGPTHEAQILREAPISPPPQPPPAAPQ